MRQIDISNPTCDEGTNTARTIAGWNMPNTNAVLIFWKYGQQMLLCCEHLPERCSHRRFHVNTKIRRVLIRMIRPSMMAKNRLHQTPVDILTVFVQAELLQ